MTHYIVLNKNGGLFEINKGEIFNFIHFIVSLCSLKLLITELLYTESYIDNKMKLKRHTFMRFKNCTSMLLLEQIDFINNFNIYIANIRQLVTHSIINEQVNVLQHNS